MSVARLLTACLLLFAATSAALAADSGARPAAALFELSPLDAVALYVTAPFDLDAVRAEDVQRQAEGLPPRFAIPEPVRITPAERGSWE